MATYTMTIYEIINNFFSREEVETWFSDYELSEFLTNEEIKTINERNTFSKEKLASFIVDYYLMEEIGLETMGLFRHKVKTKMKKIMSEKLPLIYSMSIKFDPLVNVDYTEIFKRDIENNGNSNSSSTSSGNGLNIGSDTPQGNISKDDILAGNYATSTNASETTTTINDNSSANNLTNENYTKNIKGNSGVSATAQKMIEQYRSLIVNLYGDICNELSDCFMIIY